MKEKQFHDNIKWRPVFISELSDEFKDDGKLLIFSSLSCDAAIFLFCCANFNF